MAPFTFRLQQILDYRGQLEDQARMEFAKAQSDYDTQAETVSALRETLAQNEARLYETATISPSEHWLIKNYVQRLTQDLGTEENTLLQLAQNLNRKRQNLVKRSQDKKLLDKLKEKQQKRHAHEERLKEQHQFDETATIRYKAETF